MFYRHPTRRREPATGSSTLFLLAALGLPTSPVFAQEAPAPVTELDPVVVQSERPAPRRPPPKRRTRSTEPAIALDEIVVQGERVSPGAPSRDPLNRSTAVASRLNLSVKETPATVDVLTQERMQERGNRSLTEAFQSVPGVVAGNLPGGPGITAMRGLPRFAVGYSVDGFRAMDPLIASRNYDTYSFERIEILKGPASVVSGTGALAGTINLVTRNPELSVNKADALLSYGSFGTVRAGTSFNAAISPNAAASASVLYGRAGGFINDTDSENVQVTTGLLLQPTDRLKLTFAFDYFRDRDEAPYQGTPLLPRKVARDPSGIVSAGDLVLDRSIWKQNYNVANGITSSDAISLRTGAEYELSANWTFRSDFNFYSADRRWANSENYTYNAATGLLNRSASLITHDHQSWSNRTAVNYDGELAGHRNRFTAGFEYMKTDFGSGRLSGSATPVDPFHPMRGYFPDTSSFATREDHASNVGHASLFIEDAFNITPNWLVVGGLRKEWIDLDRTIDNLNTGATATFGRDFDPTSWRIGTVYDVTPGVSFFAQYTTAVAPVSGLLLSNMQNAQFDLTTGKSVEAGIKASLWDDRLIATASVYQIDQDNILTRDPNNPLLTVQGGSQRSRGIELDLAFAVTDQWKLSANAALVDAEFTKLFENGVSREGNRPPNISAQTANLWTTYRLASVPVTFGAGLRYVSSFYTDNANSIRVDGRILLDASITYDVPIGGTLTLRGRNLMDELYAERSGYSATQVYIGAPRSVDLTYSVNF